MNAQKMKAAVYTQYGPPEVLQLKEIEKPQPKDNEVLIKIHATAVSSGDARMRRADPFAVRLFFGLFGPRKHVLGGVFSGEVEAVGKSVTKFKVGEAVFGATGMQFGAYAQYISLPETGVLVVKPENVSHEEAAAVPFGGETALHFLRKAGVQPGQKVLIYGASGAVGTAAVQLAKYFGAEVTGVSSAANTALVKSLGADHVIDYTRTDFTKSGEQYDVIIETVGKTSCSQSLPALKKNGKLVLISATFGEMFRAAWASLSGSKKVITGVAAGNAEDYQFLKDLMETGKLKAVIDSVYPLEKIAEAHRLVDTGRKKGNVVVVV